LAVNFSTAAITAWIRLNSTLHFEPNVYSIQEMKVLVSTLPG